MICTGLYGLATLREATAGWIQCDELRNAIWSVWQNPEALNPGGRVDDVILGADGRSHCVAGRTFGTVHSEIRKGTANGDRLHAHR